VNTQVLATLILMITADEQAEID